MKNIIQKVFISGLQLLAGCYHRSSNLDPADETRWYYSAFCIRVVEAKKSVMMQYESQGVDSLLGSWVAR